MFVITQESATFKELLKTAYFAGQVEGGQFNVNIVDGGVMISTNFHLHKTRSRYLVLKNNCTDNPQILKGKFLRQFLDGRKDKPITSDFYLQ